MGGINQIYILSLLLKGFNALLECGVGAYLGISKTADFDALVHWLMDFSIFKGEQEWIAAAVFDYANSIPDATRNFFAIYLLLHGLVKVVMVGGLLMRFKWAYPAAMVALSLFICYQTYEYSSHHAIGLLLLTVFDLFVLMLIINDYRQKKMEPHVAA
jgi:uncharacterized membrane protein